MVAPSETKDEILPAIPPDYKMIFPCDHIPVRKVLLKDAKISVETQEKLNGLIHALEDIMSSSSNDIGYTKLIDMDIETDPNLPSVASKPYTLPPKWVRKELEDLKRQDLSKEVFHPVLHPL